MRIPAYAKTIVAGIVAVIGVIVPILGQDDVLTTTDIVQMALGILAAFGVYVVPNAPSRVLREDQERGPYGEKL